MKTPTLRTIAVTLTAAVVSVTLLSSAAFAQSGPIKANIPFDFYVEAKLMPAGIYTVRTTPGIAAVQISDLKGHCMFVGTILTGKQSGTQNRLVFHRIGNASFLSELEWSGSDQGRALQQTSYERQLAGVNAPVRVALTGK